ncbi:uncharacterized protein LOC123563719 [Mercenaria mercenaria]|uniref:uncharacterized protein LOC123563719 n=1 Tax=Mercenaria mercenaria TaxID=6596 RepID=UPI001E1E1DA0|nr:uncharacterized protein LOC123563719 [Mercenaria mercenaria]
MSLIRRPCVFFNLKCKVLTPYSLPARISTSVLNHKSESPKDSQPYPFMSKMKENQYRIEETFQVKENYNWKYQPHVIFGCIITFFVYFVFLREEHELDWAIAKQLYAGIPGLEEQDLRKSIEKAKKQGKDTTLYEERLNVLLAEKKR